MFKNKIIAVLSILLIACNLRAQPNINAENIESYVEKVALVFDRDLYVVNEVLSFKAVNISNSELKALEWSKVLYVEIITCDGKSMFQGKFPFGKNGGDGAFKIPSDILTGNYYIKAYTKWMRNFANVYYFYAPISIINPYFDKMAQKPDMYEPDFKLDTITYQKANVHLLVKDSTIGINSKAEISVKSQAVNKESKMVELEIDGRKVKVNQSEVAHLIGSNETAALENKNAINYSLSVVKSGTVNQNKIVPIPPEKSYNYNLKFYPETRGVTVSGKLVDLNGNALINKTIHISVFNGYTETQSSLTDTLGNFTFAIPVLYGNKEILVLADLKEEHKVLLDNDFCSKPVYLPFIPFQLDAAKYNLYSDLVKNGQIASQYSIKADSLSADTNKIEVIYYNEPTQQVVFDDFVQMPSIEDYINELLTLVTVNRSGDETFLKVYGAFSELSLYKPLVMIDDVVVTDVTRLLAVDPRVIDRVEVLSYPYIKGNNMYGGVVNFYSKNGDMGNMELPETGLYFDYTFFNPLPQLTNERVLLSNTLEWVSDMKNDYTDLIETGVNYGNFTVRILGIDNNGIVYLKQKEFEIK